MSFPRYPEYKDSGVEWLGQVPGHWEVIRLKNVLQRRITDGPHTTPEFVDDGVPFLSVDGIQDGELQFDGCRFISETDHAEYRKKALPRKDDLLMGKAASTGKIARVKVDFEFSIWSPLALIRLDPMFSSPAFYEQSLKSPIAQAQIDNLCTANTQKNISMDDIPKLILTRPPLPEQVQIAAFLDRETAKIDALLAEQRRLTALLREKRQAVISHAVTRGLNPHAPMKPSGIEWLGDVPEHWEVVPLKYLCLLLKDGTHLPPERVDDGVPLLSVRNLVDGEFTLRSDDSMISEENYQFLCRAFVPKAEDVLLAIVGATLGKTAVIPSGLGPFHIQRSVAIFRTHQEVIQARFLNLVFQCGPFQALLWEMVGYSAQPGIYLGTLENIRIAVPPVVEQTRMLESIFVVASELADLTTEAQHAIDLLQERRTALISAAVTGQIDVRGAAE